MRLLVLPALLLAFAASASAQINKGNLTGVVTDPSGSAVPRATLRLVNTGTGAEKTEIQYAIAACRYGEDSVGSVTPSGCSGGRHCRAKARPKLPSPEAACWRVM